MSMLDMAEGLLEQLVNDLREENKALRAQVKELTEELNETHNNDRLCDAIFDVGLTAIFNKSVRRIARVEGLTYDEWLSACSIKVPDFMTCKQFADVFKPELKALYQEEKADELYGE